MTGLVEQFALQVGWTIARHNVVVEGTSDVAFLTRASELHAAAKGRPVFDEDFAVVAAGRGDDGGVDGVNRRLSLIWQLADVDRDAAGALRHRFIGLLDNDAAGRSAFATACRFDRRVAPYGDLFLLRPVMPLFPINLDRNMEVARANLAFRQLDWEIEDLCSERILVEFERHNPGSILSRVERGGLIHHEFVKSAKPKLRRYFINSATIEDAKNLLNLLKSLRGYLNLDHDFITI